MNDQNATQAAGSSAPACSPALRATEDAVLAVIRERQRQDAKWGEQNHDAGTWALILLEEIGEWAKAELHARFGGPDAGNEHTEAVHMTAVALAVIECMNRKANTGLHRTEPAAGSGTVRGLVGASDSEG
jgi:hypothetical protein